MDGILQMFPESGNDAAKAQGIPISTVDPTNGQVLVYNSTTRQYEPGAVTPSAATTTVPGIVELATDAETQTGTDTARVPPASALAAWWTWAKTQAQTFAGNLTLNGTANVANNQLASSGGALMTRDLVDARAISPSQNIFRDDFSNGGRTSGIIGESGWGLSGTSASVVERSSSGVFPNNTTFRLTTGGTSGQFARIYTATGMLGGSANFATRTGWESTFIFALPDISNVTFACGFSGNPNATDFQDRLVGVRFKSGTDTNWQFICKNDVSTFAVSASSTLSDSGVAASSNAFVKVDMRCLVAGTIQFRINGGTWADISTNVPTSLTSLLYFWVEPTTSSARFVDVDFAAWKVDTSR